MAPLTGRQIGVAIPMTASTTPTTTSTPLWTATTTTEAASARKRWKISLNAVKRRVRVRVEPAAPIDHPAASSQLTTPAAVNLLMKRTRPDDGDHKYVSVDENANGNVHPSIPRTTESTLKRTKAETEVAMRKAKGARRLTIGYL